MAALDLDLIKPVLFPLDPIPGETIRGYAGRVAEHNAYASPADLLVQAGIGLSDLWNGRADAEVLARIYGVDAIQLDPMVPKSVAGCEPWKTICGLQEGAHSFREAPFPTSPTELPPQARDSQVVKISGVAYSQRSIRKDWCPVSPSGLRRSTHHRFSWSLRQFPFCPEDFRLLLPKCPAENCGAPLRWGNGPIHLCSACNFDLRRARTRQIDREHQPYLGVAAGLVSFDEETRRQSLTQLPAFLGELTAEDALQLARTIGRALQAAGHPLANAPRSSRLYPVAMLAGMRFLLDREAGDSLGLHDDKAPERYVRSARERLRQATPLAPRSVQIVLGRVCEETLLFRSPRMTRARPKPTLSVRRRRARQELPAPAAPPAAEKGVNLTGAARMLGIERSVAKRLLQTGVLRGRTAGGGSKRAYVVIEEASVLALVEEANARISLSHLAAQYGLKATWLIEMISLGHLERAQSPYIDATYREIQLRKSSALAYLDRITGAIVRTSPDDPDRVPLAEVFALLGPGPKPWLQVIIAPTLLPDGLGSFEPNGARTSGLNVSRRCAAILQSGAILRPARQLPAHADITLSEAEEHLNCQPRDIAALIRGGALPRFGKGVSLHSVEACAKAYISSSELAGRARLPALDIATIARSKGLARPFPNAGFWPRVQAEAAFDVGTVFPPRRRAA